MILCEQPYPEILDAIAAELGGGSVELIFVRGEEMRQLNAQTRGIDKTTDVLSFPLDPAAFAGFGGDLSEENSAHENSGDENTGAANSASENSNTINSEDKNFNTKNSEGESPKDKNLKNENFDGGNFAPALLGSVVINLDLVELKAAQLGHGRDDETALLFTHGLLHVLGFDHESDNGQMRAKECEIIEKFRLPKSLIVRTEGSEE
ncbi:rRNA maturation RNase YbeY [uncultured Campylobacter sp.]|jgi:metalloprotein, YbeY family|uniref:rRNA maturation RNase YbeY n=1 Tax=uncultured Campylobacter sp. TaxID=218934 RepID=UPI0015ADF5CD|nr:rRNA maturation RNase YbeY [uncultured Campylobacter sp.]